MTKLIKRTIVISISILGGVGYLVIDHFLSSQSANVYVSILTNAFYFISLLLSFNLLIRKLEKGIEQRDKEIISKAKRIFFNDITDEESIKEVWRTTIPIRNSVGKKIGEGSVYSRVSDIARRMY